MSRCLLAMPLCLGEAFERRSSKFVSHPVLQVAH
jgi:hypothetical protein